MAIHSHITHLEKLAKGLLYLIVLLCLPDASVYASSTQSQPADFIRTEIVFSNDCPARKTISYQQALAKFGDSKILSNSYRPEFVQVLLLHDKLFKVAFTHISKQFLVCTSSDSFYQVKTIPQSSDEVPSDLSGE